MDAKFNSIMVEIIQLKKINADLHRKNDRLERRLSDIESYTGVSYEEIYENEKDSRRENIEIIGIPDSISQNNLEKTVISILESKNSKYSKCSIVIVRFIDRRKALACLKNQSKLKDSLYKAFKNSIFINENLCPVYKEILNECKLSVNKVVLSTVGHLMPL